MSRFALIGLAGLLAATSFGFSPAQASDRLSGTSYLILVDDDDDDDDDRRRFSHRYHGDDDDDRPRFRKYYRFHGDDDDDDD